MATGDKLVTLDGMKALKDALYTEPAIFEIAPAQWSGSSGDWYFTVSASNVTEDSILIPQYDVESAALLNGPIWCVPDDGEFTIHTTAIPGGTVTIMILFPGTMGVAQVQVLPDAYTTDQVDAMFDNVYAKSEVYTKTETNSAISQSTATLIGHIEVDVGGVSISLQESGKYYAVIDLSNYISDRYYIMCAIWSVNVQTNVRFELTTNRRLLLIADSAMTLPANRKVRVYYHA